MRHERQSRRVSCLAGALHCFGLRGALQNSRELDGDEQFGVSIVRRACEEPVRQIVVNCGTEGAVVAEKIKGQENPNFGFQRLYRTV